MANDICKRFGKRIKELRTANGLKQIELAERCGIDRPYLSMIENGKQEPCLRFIELLAMGLKTPLSELFKDV